MGTRLSRKHARILHQLKMLSDSTAQGRCLCNNES